MQKNEETTMEEQVGMSNFPYYFGEESKNGGMTNLAGWESPKFYPLLSS